MIAVYCRQSADKKDSISIEQQEQACAAFTFGNEYKVFKDKGFTGANTHRPAFVEMMNEVRSRQVTKIIVYKVDRISRSLQDFVGIYSEFEKYGVEFVSCNEQFDTSNAMGKATLQIIMVFAELERSMIQKRVHDNFYERGRKGLFLAGVAPFGYRKVPVMMEGIHTHMLEAEEEQIETVKMMYAEYLITGSLGAVVKKVNASGISTNRGKKFSSVTVARLLRNPVYVRADADVYLYLKSKGAAMNQPIEDYIGVYGCTIYGNRKTKTTQKFTNLCGDCVQMNLHEGVIPSGEWLAVQYELDKNKPLTNSGKGTNTWLTGLTKCGFCGLGISVVGGQRNGKRYINCGGRKAKFCYERTAHLTFDDMELVVKESLLPHLEAFAFSELSHNDTVNPRENECKIRLAKTEEEIQRLLGQVTKANETLVQYIGQRIEALDAEKRQMEADLASIRAKETESPDIALIEKALTSWDSLAFEEKKSIAQTFIGKIIVYNENVDIIYN
ncbi:MAG: recombinase family protein [Clostridia bacterium]|nr:recombinase family protein [Clostridia bacterium]